MWNSKRDRRILIRVWIKTEPLTQWDVAREFRRRVIIAFERAGIAIAVPQPEILLKQEKFYSQDKNQLTLPD